MARQILPIAGSHVIGYFGRPSWWRRALLNIGLACLRWAGRPKPMNGYAGSPVMGEAVDPIRCSMDSLKIQNFGAGHRADMGLEIERLRAQFGDPIENLRRLHSTPCRASFTGAED